MRLIVGLMGLLFTVSVAPATEMSVWVILPDETMLSGRGRCVSERRCVVMLKDWGFVVAVGIGGVFDSLYTSPDGIRIGRWIEYDPRKTYEKKDLFYYRDAMGGQEAFYLGTLYVQIR